MGLNMANEVYVCIRRTDIPDGVLQILDLDPNESQRNLVYTTPGQTKYLRNRQNDRVFTHVDGLGNRYTNADYYGLAAYLLDHVEAGGLAAGTDALTFTEANDCAAAIIALVTASGAVSLATVNAAVAGVVADTEVIPTPGGSLSNGSLADILRILSGDQYLVPANSLRSDTGGTVFVAPPSGDFVDGVYRQLYNTSSFILSNAMGHIAGFKAATFEYDGVTGVAVVAYDELGAVL